MRAISSAILDWRLREIISNFWSFSFLHVDNQSSGNSDMKEILICNLCVLLIEAL